MPTLQLPVPETYNNITRPVILDVTRMLFRLTGLHQNTPIMYISPNGAAMQPGSTLLHDPADSDLAFDDQVTVEVEEDGELDRILSTAVVYPENRFILHDPRIETVLKPVYSSHEVTINFKFRAIDEVKAKKWRDQIRTKMSQMRDLLMIDIRYAYQVAPQAIIILREIHRLMENVAPYGDSFAQWFKNSATSNMSVESNFSGTQLQPAISEHQGGIVGYWDFTGEPEKGSKEDNGETWTISFAFKFKYDKPVSVVLQYPQVIHNQVIQYKDTKPVYTPTNFQTQSPLSKTYFNYFDRTRALDCVINNNFGVRLPAWDEFVPESVPQYYIQVLTALTTLDLSTGGNPKLLMNLNSLTEGYSMDAAMQAFVIGEAPYMTKLYESVFSCNLYLSNGIMPDGSIAVDNTLNVSTTFNPNPRARFHVWFGICYNWSMLSPAALQRLRMNYPILLRLIRGLWPNWNYTPGQIGNSGVATSGSMQYLSGMSPEILQRVGFNTVETLYIQSNKGG